MAKQNEIKHKLKSGKEKSYNYDRGPEIRTRCSKVMKQELFNIADNLGLDRPSFFKMHYRKIIDSYPPHLKLPPKDY